MMTVEHERFHNNIAERNLQSSIKRLHSVEEAPLEKGGRRHSHSVSLGELLTMRYNSYLENIQSDTNKLSITKNNKSNKKLESTRYSNIRSSGMFRRSQEIQLEVDSNVTNKHIRTGSLNNLVGPLTTAREVENTWIDGIKQDHTNHTNVNLNKEQQPSKRRHSLTLSEILQHSDNPLDTSHLSARKQRHSFSFSGILRQSKNQLDKTHHSALDGSSKSGLFSSSSTHSPVEESQKRRHSLTLFRRPSLMSKGEDLDESPNDPKFFRKKLRRGSSLDSLMGKLKVPGFSRADQSDIYLDPSDAKLSSRMVRRSKSLDCIYSSIAKTSAKELNSCSNPEDEFEGSVKLLHSRAVIKYYSGNHDKATRLFKVAAEIVLESTSNDFRYMMGRRRSTYTKIPDFYLIFERKTVQDALRNDSAKFFEGVDSVDKNDTTESMVATVLFDIGQSQRKMQKYQTALECYQNAYFARTDASFSLQAAIVHNMELLFRAAVGKEDAAFLVKNCLGKQAWKILEKADKEKEEQEALERSEKILNMRNYYMFH